MDAKELPPRPNLEQYKKQAKELVRSKRNSGLRCTLSDAQFSIARDHGFESWPKFAKHIRALTGEDATATVWRAAEHALIAMDVPALARIMRENESLFREQQPPAKGAGRLAPDYSGGDARTVMV